MVRLKFGFVLATVLVAVGVCSAQRVSVLDQIKLLHNYYFRELYLPQLTSGPSWVAWMPDGKSLVYSKAGSLWKFEINESIAQQLTDGEGYDYQPDVSPDGMNVVFVRYNGEAVHLMLLNLVTGKTKTLTEDNEVYLEPRWSPDGKQIALVSTLNSGHFLLHIAKIENDQVTSVKCLTADRKSALKRYYYSEFDHAVNPVWSRDGKEIIFISNREIVNGTGDIVKINIESGELKTLHHEETNWKTKPDISPDGTRMVYSSYLGRNWHQLWLLPVAGGSPMPITYGEFDNTSPRWSPDGEKIAFISNRTGNTSLWLIKVFDGAQQMMATKEVRYLSPRVSLSLNVVDEDGKVIPARISITDSRGKFYAPEDVTIRADDSRYPDSQQFESHYFHSSGSEKVEVPFDKLNIQVSRGPEYEIAKIEIDTRQSSKPVTITLKKQQLPSEAGHLYSGDLHVHMNYGGSYRNTPEILAAQAEAEALDFVFNFAVNKEQRIPDISYFTTKHDPSSKYKSVILNGQEFHTSFWGHLGFLNLNDHFILPDYSGYPQTAAASFFPHNGFVADRAHDQKALVGYVHPFETSEIFPEQSENLFNALPIDAALGKVDYYEVIGFAEHKASETVWHQLLNCGFHIPVGAGTDAMANYASLRGPIGLNRVYASSNGEMDYQQFLKNLKEGKTFVTNGPLIGFSVEGKNAGDSISISSKGQNLSYKAFLRSQVPIDHVEVIWNGEVIAKHVLTGSRTTVDASGSIRVKGSGWVLFRVWNDKAHPDVLDMYPFATTNPIYIKSADGNLKRKMAASYFLKWVSRIEAKTPSLSFRTESEKNLVLQDIKMAKRFYQNLVK